MCCFSLDMVARKMDLLAATEELLAVPEVFDDLYMRCFLMDYYPSYKTLLTSKKADNIIHQHIIFNYPFSVKVVMKLLMERKHQLEDLSQHISALQLMTDLIIIGVLVGASTSSVRDVLYNYSIPSFVSKEIWATAQMKRWVVPEKKLDVMQQTLQKDEIKSLCYQQWVFDHVCIILLLYLGRPTVVTVFIAHFSRVIHSAEIDRLTAL